MKKSTWLPIFSGYYNGWFEPIDNFIDYESGLDSQSYKEHYEGLYSAGIPQDFFNENLWDCLEYDYMALYNELSEDICNAVEKLDTQGIVKSIEFEELISPKEYNFFNDSINCKITYNQTKLMKFIKSNMESFSYYILERYTRRDGFIPSYPNDRNYWLNTANHNDHEIGAILNFMYFELYGQDVELEEICYKVNCLELAYKHISVNTEKMIELFKTRKIGA